MMANKGAAVSSSTSVTVVPSQSQSSTSQQPQQPQQTSNVVVDDVLSAILESPNFTVAEYLNTALYDVIEPKTSATSNNSNSSSNNNTPIDHYSSAVIHRLTELAVSLQMQTQTSHDTISRTGMELQTILPRCENDLQRLQTSYMNVLSDCQQLHSDCCIITNHNHNHTNTSGTGNMNSMSSDDVVASSSGGGGTTVMTTTNEKKLHTTSTTTTTSNSSNVETATSNSSNSNHTTTTTTATAAKAAMETLGTLHALQTNLRRTKEILIALDVWDTTINAISNYIVQENTADAVQCLISLQQSEWTLRGMKEQADQRKFTLHKLQQQVTTVLLQPNLVHALSVLPQYHPDSSSSFSSMVPSTPSLSVTNTTNTTVNNNATTITTVAPASSATTLIAPIQQCVQLYRQLNQLDTLTFEYIKQRPIPIQKLWFDTYQVNIPPTTNPNSNTIEGVVDYHHGESQLEHPMIQWLPNYYQQVLHFINEERQLCEQIFHNHTSTTSTGTATASAAIIIPTILIQIVQECFRTNIISSFTSRLHTIYNPNNNTTTAMSSSVSTFPIIATLYESTIQFLSLLYENVVSSYMDMIESSSSSTTTTTSMTTKGNDVYQLYQQICMTFMSIVLPFREYQGKQYHQIELQYVQVTIQPNIKAIQQLTKHMKSNTDMTVEVLQETMDQLQSVATNTIFTLLESTLQRYELLNGGYYIVDMIQMMDKNILHQYMNEISITVHTLSAYIVQNESSQFVKIFEEEHVSIALQTLLMMNQLIQSVHQIEHDTMIMIQRLYDRIRNYHNQEERRNRNTTTSFQLSETLSMVEVNTILTKNVAMGGEETKNDSNEATTLLSNTIATLQRWITSSSSSNSATTKTPLLTSVHETIQQKLLLSCHTFIFDVCYAIPRYYLSSIVSYKSWKADSSTASVNEYGTLPQEYMTHIGEHMLALVQALEPFAMNNDYLQQVNQNTNIVMNPKLIRRVVQPIWIDVVSAMGNSKNGIQGNNVALQILMNGTDLIDYVLGDVVTIQHDETETNQDDDEDNNDDDDNHKAVTSFCNTWLDVISTAMTGRLIERILRIPLLTNQGCEHVQADLAYIINVLTALGIPGHPHPLLTHIATLATLDETVLRERHDAMSSSYDNPETTVSMRLIQSIEQRFIAMRSFG